MDKRKKRRSKAELLDEGLRILTTHGEGALTIDSLCKKFGVTKGSFYHHFKSREDFSRQLLEHWVQVHTQYYIDMCEKSETSHDQLCALDSLAVEVDHDAENAMRAWALRDPLAREYIERVDTLRIGFLQNLYAQMLGDKEEAAMLAHLEYAMFIGVYQIMPAPPKAMLEEMPYHWLKVLKKYRPEIAS